MRMYSRRRSGRGRWRARPTHGLDKARVGRSTAFRSGSRICSATEGVRTTARLAHPRVASSRPTKAPSPQLCARGAVMLGKLNMDEFAMGSSNETRVYGPVINPWRRQGSRRGAGARRIVGRFGGGGRRRIALGATGTDTGGSIRQPAAFSGICRDQADLRPLLALGHRRVRVLARSGRADRADRARCRDSARARWPATTRRIQPRVDLPVPDYEAAYRRSVKGMTHRNPEGISARRHARGDRDAVDAGHRRG